MGLQRLSIGEDDRSRRLRRPSGRLLEIHAVVCTERMANTASSAKFSEGRQSVRRCCEPKRSFGGWTPLEFDELGESYGARGDRCQLALVSVSLSYGGE
jgi:hypothetical protein